MTLILNLQHWSGDKKQAMMLARLIADLEPVRRTDVTFLFSARFDCEFDEDTIAYVAHKFPVRRFKGRSHGTGWPAGPNGLFSESHMHCVERIRDKTINATGILFMEADCVPLHANWINMLIEEWNSCGKMVLGAWLKAGDCGIEHINGNCIIHKDFWRKNREIFNPKNGGWDADFAQLMLPNGAPSKLIWSDYGLGKPGYNDWKGCGYLFEPKRYRATDNPLYGQDLQPVWLHGPKIMEGINCMRERLIGKPLMHRRKDFGFTLNDMGLTGEGVEIGVFRGENAEDILNSWKGERLFLVDPWINQTKDEYLDGTQQNDFNEVYESAKARLAKFGERAWFCKQTSKECSSELPSPNERFDFVYIDGKHDYSSVVEDIKLWWPTVKKGGILGGHDYLHEAVPGVFDCGVTKAVDDFVRINNLKLHFTPDDDVKSWFVQKSV